MVKWREIFSNCLNSAADYDAVESAWAGIELGPADNMKSKKPIESLILTLRELRVILAPDPADVYGVKTRVLNQAVKRNAERFPEDFIFQLTAGEFSALKDAGKVSGDGRQP
jgi:hypothetical protein